MTKKSSSSSKKKYSPWVLIAGVAIVLAIALGSSVLGKILPGGNSGDATLAPPTLAPLTSIPPDVVPQPDMPVTSLPRANVVQGNWYTLYFTIPSYPEKKDGRSGGIDQAIIGDLERAQRTIDAAVFDFRLPSLTDAFGRAAQRGVQVRLVTDYAANGEAPDYQEAISKMEKAGVKVTRDHRSALMHNKFVVIDNRLLWTGSMNFTPNDVYRNNNNMLRLAIPALIENYNTRFERLFQARGADAPGKQVPNPRVTLDKVTIENYFSPTGGTAQAITDKLNAAKKSIRFTAFTFTDTAMADLIKAQAKSKLTVQGILEARNNSGLGAEYEGMKSAGLDVLEDGNCYILHSKVMVIDNRYVVMGSYNFTANAEKSNDENVLIIDDPQLAKEYTTEFNRIYKQAKNPTDCGGSKSVPEPNIGGEQ